MSSDKEESARPSEQELVWVTSRCLKLTREGRDGLKLPLQKNVRGEITELTQGQVTGPARNRQTATQSISS